MIMAPWDSQWCPLLKAFFVPWSATAPFLKLKLCPENAVRCYWYLLTCCCGLVLGEARKEEGIVPIKLWMLEKKKRSERKKEWWIYIVCLFRSFLQSGLYHSQDNNLSINGFSPQSKRKRGLSIVWMTRWDCRTTSLSREREELFLSKWGGDSKMKIITRSVSARVDSLKIVIYIKSSPRCDHTCNTCTVHL